MRILTALAATLLSTVLSLPAAHAATVFHETFQDDLSRMFGGMPYSAVPIDYPVTVSATAETYREPTTGITGTVLFRSQNSGQPLQIARRGFCLSGCAQFSVSSGYTLRSYAGQTPILLSGQDYRLSVSLLAINSLPATTPSTRLFMVALQGGSVRASSVHTLFNDGDFSTYTLNIDGASLFSTYTEFALSFSPIASGAGLYIDEILLESVPAAAVPLPASGLLLLFGAGTLVVARRRKGV